MLNYKYYLFANRSENVIFITLKYFSYICIKFDIMILKLLASLILGIGKHKKSLSLGVSGLTASVLTAQATQVNDVTQDPLLNAIIQIIIAISTIIAIFKKNKNK